MTGLLAARGRAAVLAGVDLEEVRLDCGFTQETIAAALGVRRTTVSAWERCQNHPSEAYCRVVAGLLRHLAVTWGEPS